VDEYQDDIVAALHEMRLDLKNLPSSMPVPVTCRTVAG